MTSPTPDMPLAEFATDYYMKATHHRSGRPPGQSTLNKMLALSNHLAAILDRPPMVKDLTAENLTALDRHLRRVCRRRKRTVLLYGDTFRSAWRYAADLGLVPIDAAIRRRIYTWNPDHDGKVVRLSGDEGTLWHLCLTAYFPKSLRIRSEHTKTQYQFALRDFKAYLGHEPTTADLTEDNVIGLMKSMLDRGKAPKTVNERKGRLTALWKWLASRRMVEMFPTIGNLKEPRRIPKAWTQDELRRLIEACRHAGGKIGNVWASDFWVALHLVLWDSAERISATLAIRWDWIDFQTGDLSLPAEVRKGKESDAVYRLGANTLASLQRLRHNGSELVFFTPWNTSESIHYKYKTILKMAGLSHERNSAFHKMRRSVASHLHAAGHNATDALGHSSADVTRASYLDPRISGAVRPSDVLFQIDADDYPFASEPPRLLGYREAEPIEEVAPEMAWL